jgi:iron complex outermembrane recepter protein
MKSSDLGKRRKTLYLAIACVFANIPYSVRAQQSGEAIEEVQVTGSRIRQTDGMVTPVPITAVTTEELVLYNPGGTVSEQLNTLPQFFGNSSITDGRGPLFGGGASSLNMRNLGPRRTLVLFDGSRVVPGGSSGTVDVDILPTALIRTVDVVTGGASAAYGADALGGVANFVLDREFQGLKFESGGGINEFGDGQRWNMSLAGGKQIGDRLNIIGSIEARQIGQITRDPEDLDSAWFQRWSWVTNPQWFPGAPSGVPQRLTLPWVSSSEASPTGVIWARTGTTSTSTLKPFSLNGMTFLEDGSDVRQFIKGDVYAAPNGVGSTKTMSGGPEGGIHNRAFEGGPAGSQAIGRSGFTAVKYDLTDDVSVFAQALIGRRESNVKNIRSIYTMADQRYATIERKNAFLPKNVADAMDKANITSFQLHKWGSFLGDNNVGTGPGKDVSTLYSWSLGFNAILPNDWELKGSWQSGQTHQNASIYGRPRTDRIYLALDAVRDPATGAIVCNVQLYNPTPAQLAASVAGKVSPAGGPLLSPIGLDNSIRDCVPYNVMGAGNMSQAAVDYTMSPRIEQTTVDQDFAEVVLTGELFDSLTRSISFAAGLTYREQAFVSVMGPEEIYTLGPPLNALNLGIRGIPPGYTGGSPTLHQFGSNVNNSGEYDVWEAFGELNIPIWASQTTARRVDSSVAYRSSEYSSVGRIDSWKIGVDYQLFDDLRFRSTKSRDVREAAFIERFGGRGGPGNVNDPRFNNSPFLITVMSGGNPTLTPEIADTVVAGFVYQPSWFEGARFSADWYEIKIKDSVGTLGQQRIVDECETNRVQSLCAQVERDPKTGLITRVFNTYLNVAQAKVEGIDFEAGYTFEPDFLINRFESFNVRLLGGYIKERSDTPLGGTPFDVSGALNTPDLTANASIAYTIEEYSLQLQHRYIASTLRNASWVEGRDVDKNSVSSGNYTNFRLDYRGEMANTGEWVASLNVSNLFNRNPPIVAEWSTLPERQTLIPSGYDDLGRRYMISLNISF